MEKVEVIGRIDLDNQTTVNDVTIKRDKRSISFSVHMQISKEHARKLQGDLAYHPAGYGFYSFEATPTKTTWKCYTSCD